MIPCEDFISFCRERTSPKRRTKNKCGKFHAFQMQIHDNGIYDLKPLPTKYFPNNHGATFSIRLSCPSLFLAWISSIAIGQGHSCHIRKGGMKAAWRNWRETGKRVAVGPRRGKPGNKRRKNVLPPLSSKPFLRYIVKNFV